MPSEIDYRIYLTELGNNYDLFLRAKEADTKIIRLAVAIDREIVKNSLAGLKEVVKISLSPS